MMGHSAFEILGPIMVGPSSSHTAGALRIALVARSLAKRKILAARFELHNSFSQTHTGHGTDQALVAGLLGFAPDDIRVRSSFELARVEGLEFSFVEAGENPNYHPNTVSITMELEGGGTTQLVGESIGGGAVRIREINGINVRITGEMPTIFVSHYDLPGVLAHLTKIFSADDVNIASMRTFREEKGGKAYTIFELDESIDDELIARLREHKDVRFANLIDVPGAPAALVADHLSLGFSNGSELLAYCAEKKMNIGELMYARECELEGSADVVAEKMKKVLATMREEVQATIDEPEVSLGGFLYGQAARVAGATKNPQAALMGPLLTQASAYAMAVLERSANMGIIVAAPTAGSSGVVPGVLLSAANEFGWSEKKLTAALWASAAVGAIIAEEGSVSGAEGGCQAEVGTAAAMAAAALAEACGARPKVALTAASIAITNMLGLVCDPVQGLVEYPCQLRNAAGVACAISSAQLALSGIESPLPFDEVVLTMKNVGEALPSSLRETALGGLAATANACSLCGRC